MSVHPGLGGWAAFAGFLLFLSWFFLALAPAHTPPRPDGVETTEARWFQPAAALEAQGAGELVLSFPTQTQLRWLAEFRTSCASSSMERSW